MSPSVDFMLRWSILDPKKKKAPNTNSFQPTPRAGRRHAGAKTSAPVGAGVWGRACHASLFGRAVRAPGPGKNPLCGMGGAHTPGPISRCKSFFVGQEPFTTLSNGVPAPPTKKHNIQHKVPEGIAPGGCCLALCGFPAHSQTEGVVQVAFRIFCCLPPPGPIFSAWQFFSWFSVQTFPFW